ncbi:MAG: proline--tRNA ligase, partial [Candidatus Marinimicrobia bacterium]|nr:proline--tRNA ligase [Candidatus Neomarinimicrobiota bacterium]
KAAYDLRFKETGHENAYFPLFIPKSYMSREAQHVEGFAKECAVVTHTRLRATEDGSGVEVDPDSKLDEELIIRPTSETVIWSLYKQWINSYRDLPILINQWVNIVRWEMRTRLFLRTTEFLWQEGHTAHATKDEAVAETLKMIEVYRQVAEDELALPVIVGLKSEAEKFAGAEETWCIEAMMGDKRALQSGTSHYLGQNFAKAFDVTFRNEANEEQYVYATSWGVSTRLIGAVIMAHGDDQGLRLPPNIAPIQAVIVPIYKDDSRDEVLGATKELASLLEATGARIKLDDRDTVSPGFKFNEWEMKGVPVRIELGPRDLKQSTVMVARRDTGEKLSFSNDQIVSRLPELLTEIQSGLYKQARDFREANTYSPGNWDEFKELMNTGGFARCGWDGDPLTEAAIKNETKATVRCILDEQEPAGIKCIHSGKPARYLVIFAKAY